MCLVAWTQLCYTAEVPVLFLIALSAFFAVEGGAVVCPILLRMADVPARSPTNSTAIEWTAPRVAFAPYLTTHSGRVGGLLPHIRGNPDWLMTWWNSSAALPVRQRYSRVPLPRELPWGALPIEVQNRLINYSVRAEMNFPLDLATPVSWTDALTAWVSSRSVGMEHLKVAGRVRVHLPQAEDFFGVRHSAGIFPMTLEPYTQQSSFPGWQIGTRDRRLEPAVSLSGEVVAPGEQFIGFEEMKNGAVEHDGVEAMFRLLNQSQIDGFQVHFRSPVGAMSAGTFIRSIGRMAQSLGDEHPEFHAHIVESLPLDLLHEGGALVRVGAAASMIDLLLRANELEEYRALMTGHPIILRRSKEDHTTIWATMEATQFHKLFKKLFHLISEGEGIDDPRDFPHLGDDLKCGYVGMHWSTRLLEKYDRQDVWGLHLRSLDRSTPLVTAAAVADALQYQMYYRLYAQHPHRISRWLQFDLDRDVYSPRDVDQLALKIARARWNQPWEVLFENALPDIAAELDAPFRDWLVRATEFRNAGVEEHALHLELKMLLHRSDYTLSFFDRVPLGRRIHEAQLRALRKIKALSRGGAYELSEQILHIMQTYLTESGLWQHSLLDFGLVQDPSPAILHYPL